MKKYAIAIAATLAASAYAADSVTLYGIADAWVGQTKTAGQTTTQTKVQSGGLSTSRLGLTVKEDLGDGLSAFAAYETGVAVDTGASGGPRKSVVGLSGGFGSVSVGFETTPYEDLFTKTFSTMDSAFDGMKLAHGKVDKHDARFKNGIRYNSPTMSGFSGSVHVGLGEDKDAARAQRDTSLALRYAQGPLLVALAYQSDEKKAANTAPTKVDNTAIAGSYDFGAAKLNLGYNLSKRTGSADKEKSINVGVAVPMGAVTVLAQVGRSKLDNNPNAWNAYGVEARYALSKRSTLYVGAGQAKQKNVANAVDRNIGFGMRHTF